MLVLGSPNLVDSLAHRALLDELRIMVNPVAIGHGAGFAHAVTQHVKCSLEDVRRIGSDNVLLNDTTRRHPDRRVRPNVKVSSSTAWSSDPRGALLNGRRDGRSKGSVDGYVP